MDRAIRPYKEVSFTFFSNCYFQVCVYQQALQLHTQPLLVEWFALYLLLAVLPTPLYPLLLNHSTDCSTKVTLLHPVPIKGHPFLLKCTLTQRHTQPKFYQFFISTRIFFSAATNTFLYFIQFIFSSYFLPFPLFLSTIHHYSIISNYHFE